ncbi:hypothetical protein PCNPT3_10740 [Psychromonas sp. CNPT3]|nr:hypothetical protein PCNPT3_10740 [Psychromonas sp. CNPT3]
MFAAGFSILAEHAQEHPIQVTRVLLIGSETLSRSANTRGLNKLYATLEGLHSILGRKHVNFM